jgi:DNA-binding transcriptional LysR family regulator
MEIGWELYHSFLGVLQEGSLSAAARALGLTQPTVGRHVAALERGLRLSLFTRSPHGLTPTDAALALQPHAQAMASTAAALKRTADSQGAGVRGTVRVTASDVIGVEVLPSIVAALTNRYPELRVELVLTNRVQDLLRREADIAVRMTPPRQEQLIARRIGAIKVGLHAHRDYLARRGTPRTLLDLADHVLIGFDTETAYVRSMLKSLHGLTRESLTLRSDSDLAQMALIRSGAGIGFCQVPIARRSGDLVRVLPRPFAVQLETWITMHEDLRGSPRCRVTFDALVEGLRAHLAIA